MTRRRFLTAAATSLAARRALGAPPGDGFKGTLCFFSKHLPEMNAPALGRALRSLGFGGVDLTVRPGGHVAPERAATDLAPFVNTLREAGLEVPFITTGLVADSEPAARGVLEAAARSKIPLFKPGYYRYAWEDVRKELAAVAVQLRGLAGLSARSGVRLGFHNHAGYVGGSVWDVAPIIDALDPRWAGYYFDVRHAVVEGGDGGWRSALQCVAPRLLMIAVKDFHWEKTAKGWRQRNCPLGEGMVDWKRYFAALAKARFHGPVSLHLEYEIPGETAAARQENTLAAAAKDLAFLRAHLTQAYSSPGA